MFLRILAEETCIGELHLARYLMNRQRGTAQVVLDLRYRDFGYPLAG